MEEDKKENKKKTDVDPGEQLIDFFVPKDPRLRGDDSLIVSVNGDEIRVKPGVKVKIKRKFAEVLQNSMQADAEALNYVLSNELK